MLSSFFSVFNFLMRYFSPKSANKPTVNTAPLDQDKDKNNVGQLLIAFGEIFGEELVSNQRQGSQVKNASSNESLNEVQLLQKHKKHFKSFWHL